MGQAVSILINYVLSEDSHRVVQLARSKSLRVRIHTMYLLHFYRERQYILCIYIEWKESPLRLVTQLRLTMVGLNKWHSKIMKIFSSSLHTYMHMGSSRIKKDTSCVISVCHVKSSSFKLLLDDGVKRNRHYVWNLCYY